MHQDVSVLIEGFRNKELHAAYSGRELMRVLVQIAKESDADTSLELAGEIESTIDQILPDLPAYAPPLNVIHIVMSVLDEALSSDRIVDELRDEIIAEGDRYQQWSRMAREKIIQNAFEIIPDGGKIFTFTLSETVLTTLMAAWKKGKRFQVFVTESRPNNDGLDTANRLAEIGVPVAVSIDACMTAFITKADIVLSGAEAVLTDGSAICKVGTYLVGLVSREAGIPFYVLVDTMKFNVSSIAGIELELDPLTQEDFIADLGTAKYSIAGSLFDNTPSRLIRGIITERGIIIPNDCGTIMSQMRLSEKFIRKLKRAS